jgi:hypothetical protein
MIAVDPASATEGGRATATYGRVSATLSWEAGSPGVSKPHLTITRFAEVVLDRDLSYLECDRCSFRSGTRSRSGKVSFVYLDDDHEPEVLVDTYSEGRRCCYADLVYRFDGSSYTATIARWGAKGADIRNLDSDNKPEFVTNDSAFAHAFANDADSYLPVLIENYIQGMFINVTSHFPAHVRADAARIRKLIPGPRRRKRNLRGLIAAYVADENTLGHPAAGKAFLRAEIRRGDLGSNDRARAFERLLARFLHKHHYT